MKILILFLGMVCYSCNMIGAGTLGGFQEWSFPASRELFDKEISNLYKDNPQYIIPEKLKYLDSWEESGYGFLDGKIFYFASVPEELFYVSYWETKHDFLGDPDRKYTEIAVRAIHSGAGGWKTVDGFKNNKFDKDRINARFYNEILSKLEKQLNLKSKKENYWYEMFE